MKLPSNWNEIEVNQFIELRGLDSKPSDSITEKYMDLILTATDIDLEVVEDMTLDELTDKVNQLSWLRKEPHKKYSKTIGVYKILPFKKITWGMFIDLEHYYSKDYIKNMCTICGILYRKQDVDKWDRDIIEPYEYSPIERGKLFNELPITSIYGVTSDYLDYRNSLINGAYSELFGSSIFEDEEELTPEEKAERLKDEQAEAKFTKWAFESVTMGLAGDDITKMNEILDMPLIYVLNILSMKNDLK